MLVYLACPIDRDSRFWPVEEEVSAAAVDAGLAVFRPAKAFRWGGQRAAASEIYDVLTAARQASQLVLAIISPDMVSLGVPAEIEASLAEGKQVALIRVVPNHSGDVRPSLIMETWLDRLPTFEWDWAAVDTAGLTGWLQKLLAAGGWA